MTTNIFRPVKMGKEIFHAKSFDENAFVMDWSMSAGGRVPPHHHKHNDEHFLVTKGEILFVVDGKRIIKKAGEEITVPRGTFHSVSCANKEDISATVTYSPCADTHCMFQIIGALDEANPGRMITLIKCLYIMKRLGLREFSSGPAPVMAVINGILTVMGKLSGWDKLVTRFGSELN